MLDDDHVDPTIDPPKPDRRAYHGRVIREPSAAAMFATAGSSLACLEVEIMRHVLADLSVPTSSTSTPASTKHILHHTKLRRMTFANVAKWPRLERVAVRAAADSGRQAQDRSGCPRLSRVGSRLADSAAAAAPHLDAEGRFVPPAMFRGAKVTGVRDERILLGPIQPDGETRRVVAAWPQEVKAACVEVAQRQICNRTFEKVWRIVDPANTEITWVGVLEAA